jgi:alkylation response protein AidB-like acyl-CoA dehydrogenase
MSLKMSSDWPLTIIALLVVLELYGTPEQREMAIPRLLSTDPSTNWTAGQFMTERPGGSDVSKTETKATPIDTSKVAAGDKVRN